MRTFVLTDIHGNNQLFRKSLKSVGLKKNDNLIILGDFIDRGNDSKGVLDTIFLLKEHGFNVKCLRGNHEEMFINAFRNINNLNKWLINGGDKTLSSFLTSSIDKIPKKYFDLIHSFELYYEYDNFIFVHAALNMKIENPFSDAETILWERKPAEYLDNVWLGKKKLIHGHNPTSKAFITNSVNSNENLICIDNGTYINRPDYGSMCVLELNNFAVKFIA